MKNRRQAFAVLSWTAAGCWMLFLFLLSCLNGRTAGDWLAATSETALSALEAMLGPASPGLARWIELLTPATLQFLAYMLLAVLCWNAFRLCGLGINSAPAMGLAVTTLFAVTDELHQIFTPGRMPRIPDFLVSFAGALLVLGGIRLFQFAWKTYPRVVNRETVSYVVFGVLTTIINIVTYLLCSTAFTAARAMNEVVINLVSNVIAWVVAVIFAYVVNKLFVFQSRVDTLRAAVKECGLFIGARLLSLGVDAVGMVLMVNVARLNKAFSKIAMNVVVMVMNYFFSKWIIFTGKKGKELSPPEREQNN